MGLFGPSWKSNDESKQDKIIKRVNKIYNQDDLKKIVFNAPLKEVKKTALNRIINERILKEIVTYHKDEDIQFLALDKITKEKLLYDIAIDNILPLEIGNKAVEKIKDQIIIKKLLSDIPTTHRYFKIIYENIDNPSFDISIEANSKRAEDNLIKDLDNMEYPKDKDKIKLVVKKKNMENATLKAIKLLPYEEESNFLKIVFETTDSLLVKLEIINKLPMEEVSFFEKILKEGNKNIEIIKEIAKKLDNNNPLLDMQVCPNCGSFETFKNFNEYRSDIEKHVSGYSCNNCNYEVIKQNDLDVKPTISLREFIER